MNLKCVGGPCDGQTVFVNDDYKYGDQVKVHIPPRASVMSFDHAISPCSIIDASYALYQLTQVSSGTHKIMFLKDIYMSDLQAFEHLIKNHGQTTAR